MNSKELRTGSFGFGGGVLVFFDEESGCSGVIRYNDRRVTFLDRPETNNDLARRHMVMGIFDEPQTVEEQECMEILKNNP